MKKKAREQVSDFITKNVTKEHEKMMDGMKHSYYEWEDIQSEWCGLERRRAEASIANDEIRQLYEFLNKRGLKVEFEQWRRERQ